MSEDIKVGLKNFIRMGEREQINALIASEEAPGPEAFSLVTITAAMAHALGLKVPSEAQREGALLIQTSWNVAKREPISSRLYWQRANLAHVTLQDVTPLWEITDGRMKGDN